MNGSYDEAIVKSVNRTVEYVIEFSGIFVSKLLWFQYFIIVILFFNCRIHDLQLYKYTVQIQPL